MIRTLKLAVVMTLCAFVWATVAQAGEEPPIQNHELKFNVKGQAQGSKGEEAKIDKGKLKEKDVTEGCTGEKKNRRMILVIQCDTLDNVIVIIDDSTNPATVVEEIGVIDFDGDPLLATKKGEPTNLSVVGEVELSCGGSAAGTTVDSDIEIVTVFEVKTTVTEGGFLCPKSAKSTSVVGAGDIDGEDVLITSGTLEAKKAKDFGVGFSPL